MNNLIFNTSVDTKVSFNLMADHYEWFVCENEYYLDEFEEKISKAFIDSCKCPYLKITKDNAKDIDILKKLYLERRSVVQKSKAKNWKSYYEKNDNVETFYLVTIKINGMSDMDLLELGGLLPMVWGAGINIIVFSNFKACLRNTMLSRLCPQIFTINNDKSLTFRF